MQEVLQEALARLLKEDVNLMGAGRTDTGVHANQFYCHFDIHKRLSEEYAFDLIFHLNQYLPKDIALGEFLPVKSKAHARFSARSRTYKYYISLSKDPFAREFSYQTFVNPNVSKMQQATDLLFEYKDFACFSKSNTEVKTNICNIMQAKWTQEKRDMLVFTIQADRFLRNMVRAIVGTLLDIGTGKMAPDNIRKIIESQDRSKAGYSVPARGLFLHKVEYPEDIFLRFQSPGLAY